MLGHLWEVGFADKEETPAEEAPAEEPAAEPKTKASSAEDLSVPKAKGKAKGKAKSKKAKPEHALDKEFADTCVAAFAAEDPVTLPPYSAGSFSQFRHAFNRYNMQNNGVLGTWMASSLRARLLEGLSEQERKRRRF